MKKYLKIHPDDNLIVALQDLSAGEIIEIDDLKFALPEHIKAKHKFASLSLAKGEPLKMYGSLVGITKFDLNQGQAITVDNVIHKTTPIHQRESQQNWQLPDVSKWANSTFDGYVRQDGSVGTANYWLVFPLVFCENRNIEIIKDALNYALGLNNNQHYRNLARRKLTDTLHGKFQSDADFDIIDNPFMNVDGVKCITHTMGCGGTRQDAQALCGLMAGYLTNPNVAGHWA